MTSVKQTVYLLSEQQRNALIGYLQDRPFREVAAGIQFLLNAPTAVVNVDAPEDADTPEEQASEATEAPKELAVV